MHGDRPASWRAIRHRTRPTVVVCSICGRESANEHNALRGWREARFGIDFAYRCPNCSDIPWKRVLDDVPDEAT